MTGYAATDETDLRARVIGGFGWSMLSTVIMQVARIVTAVALARFLTPHEYGLAAMALVFSSLVLTFSDLSMGAGLVQRRRITEADRSTVFWTSLFIGALLMFVGIAASGLVASFYNEPEVEPLFAVVSISFLLASLQVAQASILQRELRFRVITMRLAAAAVIAGVVGVSAAALGAGAWAIVLSQITASFASAALLWTFSAWRPRFTFSIPSFRDLAGFGFNLFSARLITYLNRNLDNLLVGRFLGSAALGAYSIAYNIMFLPLDRLIVPIQDTLFPAYSSWQDDLNKLRTVWLRVVRVVAALVCPTMVGLSITADDFVRVVLGEKWLVAVPVLRVLALVAIIQSLAALGERVLTAVDRTGVVLRLTAIECVVTVPAFVVGLHWGIQGVAICYAIANAPVQLVYIWLTGRALGQGMRGFFQSFAGVVQAVVVMAAVLLLARGMAPTGLAPYERLAGEVVLGVIVFTAVCVLRQPEVLQDLRRLWPRRARSTKAVPT